MLSIAIALGTASPARAHGDHPAAPEAPVAAAPPAQPAPSAPIVLAVAESPPVAGTAPRVALYSARYEATAVADHGTLTIHLDRFATNAPVTDAQLEVEAGAARGPAEALPDGSYRFRHAALEATGALALRLRVVEPGQPPDTLAGTLRPGPAGSAATADGHGASGSRGAHAAHPGWQRPVLWGAAALALVGAALAAARHARRRSTSPRNAAGHHPS